MQELYNTNQDLNRESWYRGRRVMLKTPYKGQQGSDEGSRRCGVCEGITELLLGLKGSGLTVKLIRRYKNTFFVYGRQGGKMKASHGAETKSVQTAFRSPGAPRLPAQNSCLCPHAGLFFSEALQVDGSLSHLGLRMWAGASFKLRVNDDFCIGRYAGSHYSALIKMAQTCPRLD